MRFCEMYVEQVQRQDLHLPAVKLEKLKGVLKQHPIITPQPLSEKDDNGITCRCDCPQDCPVCDGTFFPSLMKDLSEIVRFFNEQASDFLEFQLASGCEKCFTFLKDKITHGKHSALVREGKFLITYALISAEAISRILKKYDEVHCSMKGQKFQSDIQTMQLEVLRSPWLYELMAFHINLLMETNDKSKLVTGLIDVCSFQIITDDGDEEKPSLSVSMFNDRTITYDLTCSICLETVFDPISLACGHIFCYMCACSAASVTTIEGLKAAQSVSKCPLCRKEKVFHDAVPMTQLNILLRRKLPKYWEERRKKERKARIKEAQAYWDDHRRMFM